MTPIFFDLLKVSGLKQIYNYSVSDFNPNSVSDSNSDSDSDFNSASMN